jgi:hypothetical protein
MFWMGAHSAGQCHVGVLVDASREVEVRARARATGKAVARAARLPGQGAIRSAAFQAFDFGRKL